MSRVKVVKQDIYKLVVVDVISYSFSQKTNRWLRWQPTTRKAHPRHLPARHCPKYPKYAQFSNSSPLDFGIEKINFWHFFSINDIFAWKCVWLAEKIECPIIFKGWNWHSKTVWISGYFARKISVKGVFSKYLEVFFRIFNNKFKKKHLRLHVST